MRYLKIPGKSRPQIMLWIKELLSCKLYLQIIHWMPSFDRWENCDLEKENDLFKVTTWVSGRVVICSFCVRSLGLWSLQLHYTGFQRHRQEDQRSESPWSLLTQSMRERMFIISPITQREKSSVKELNWRKTIGERKVPKIVSSVYTFKRRVLPVQSCLTSPGR